MDRGRETRIAPATPASASDHKALISAGEFKRLLAGLIVVHDRANGDLENYIDALAPGFVRTFAVPASLGGVLGIEAEMHERVVALAGLHDDVAALATIAARKPAARNVLPAAEGHTAVAAVAGFDSDLSVVDEHRRSSLVVSRSVPGRDLSCLANDQ